MRHIKMQWGIAPLLAIAASTAAPSSAAAPAVESFESDQVLAAYDSAGGQLRTSQRHRKFGRQSLEWQWDGPAQFGTGRFRHLALADSPLKYGKHFPASPSLSMSVYNETPQAGAIKISYETRGRQQVWFEIPLDFQGWRQVWVPFHEMQGNPPKKGEAVHYDYFRVSTTTARGKLYFDDIIFSQYQDDRHAYPDRLVPFIKSGQTAADDHWMPLLRNMDQLDRLRGAPVSAQDQRELAMIEAAIDRQVGQAAGDKPCLADARKRYALLQLQDGGGSVLGPPLTFQVDQDHFDPAQQGPRTFNDIRTLGIAMRKVAACRAQSAPADQAELDTMLVTAARYFLDQGWQAGSSGGTRHHIGYQLRELTEAFYLMRQTLSRAGLLEQVGRSLQWLGNVGMVLDAPQDFHVNLDYLHTQAYEHLMLIFMSDSRERQAALLDAYSRYLSVTLAQQKEEWGFKPDGTAWHHNGHYPAYALGAFKSVPAIIRHLAGTRFRIGKEGHANFKHAFLATAAYSHGGDIGFGNAGRHPFSDINHIGILRPAYLDLALAGAADGGAAVDADVAAAYTGQWGPHPALSAALPGLAATPLPAYATWPYAATAVQHHQDWAAIIKGYSKYVWSSEIYLDENRYGRYAANGTVQILGRGGEAASGFRQDGWDWNRYPGATVIHLPFAALEPDQPLLMFRSRETFAGAVRLGGTGAFGLVINEGSGNNADGDMPAQGFAGKLRAKKSVFSFGDKLICIGSGIASVDRDHPTQTTLFQSALTDRNLALPSSAGDIGAFPFLGVLPAGQGGGRWLLDPEGNAYHVLSANPVHVRKDVQHSFLNTYSVRTGKHNARAKGRKETEGDFASAWLEHGYAPSGAAYQYVIYPHAGPLRWQELRASQAAPGYDIVRADDVAHIALDRQSATTGYVVFEANRALGSGMLDTVSAPALVMIRDDGGGAVTLSAVQPDLNFEQKGNGKFHNVSRPVHLQLKLKSVWHGASLPPGVTLHHGPDWTTIDMACRDGLPVELTLRAGRD